MTTQAIQVVCGNKSMSRVFSVTATDGQYNNAVSATSSVNIGLEMPNTVIDYVECSYTAGLAVWRIQDSKTLKVKAYGLGNKLGYTCTKSSKIKPIMIGPSDILQVWPEVVNTTDHRTNCLGLVYTSGGYEPFGKNTIVDTTDTELVNISTSQGLGDWAFNSTLTKVCLQLQDGATLNSVTLVDQTGGTVMTKYGGIRQAVGENSNMYNIEFECAIPIQKGWTLKVNTQDN